MLNPKRIRVFEYDPKSDTMRISQEYRSIADAQGLSEWHAAVWIGRLFALDNDWGEHWLDNSGTDEKLTLDPDRFQDGKDGPCNSDKIRKLFWTDVIASFQLSLELLFAKALEVNEENRKWRDKEPNDPDARSAWIEDLEARIARVREEFYRTANEDR